MDLHCRRSSEKLDDRAHEHWRRKDQRHDLLATDVCLARWHGSYYALGYYFKHSASRATVKLLDHALCSKQRDRPKSWHRLQPSSKSACSNRNRKQDRCAHSAATDTSKININNGHDDNSNPDNESERSGSYRLSDCYRYHRCARVVDCCHLPRVEEKMNSWS